MPWSQKLVYFGHKLHVLLLELTCSVLTHMKAVKSCIMMPMGFSVMKTENVVFWVMTVCTEVHSVREDPAASIQISTQ